MPTLTFPAALLALTWGLAWAGVLWLTAWGRYIRLQRTWLSVVVGIGIDLLIAALVLDLGRWLAVGLIIAASALAIIAACLAAEYREHQTRLAAARQGRNA